MNTRLANHIALPAVGSSAARASTHLPMHRRTVVSSSSTAPHFQAAPPRNPFWPIGWVKSETGGNTANVDETPVPITADKFEVTSISTGASPLAVINGKTYAEGETIIALYGEQKIKILVVAIHDGDVVLAISRQQKSRMIIPRSSPNCREPRDCDPGDDSSAQRERQRPYSALSWRRISRVAHIGPVAALIPAPSLHR